LEQEDILKTIQRCFKEQKVLYTSHAREEMRLEEQGVIIEEGGKTNEVCYLQ